MDASGGAEVEKVETIEPDRGHRGARAARWALEKRVHRDTRWTTGGNRLGYSRARREMRTRSAAMRRPPFHCWNKIVDSRPAGTKNGFIVAAHPRSDSDHQRAP
jgi:hypothetical protein